VIEPGGPAPDFTLPDHRGKPVSLADFRGRKVMLCFYPNDFSPVCSDQLSVYQEIKPQLAASGVELLGISVDSFFAHKAFQEKLGIDTTLLATLYDTAARVGELVDLTVRDIRLEPPALVALTGKGRKTRHVPLTGNTVTLLRAYLAEHGLDRAGHGDHPLFFNQRRGKLSRGGIAWLLGKYQTKTGDPTLSNADISPHTLRHSKAMHLYEAGVPLPYIRDLLGHVELSTTEIYARASTEAKRRALEAAHTDVVDDDLPEWNQDPGLLNWLANL